MHLVLYTTEYCQLCEEAEDLIYRALSRYDYRLEKIDISESSELMEKYALRIPVLGEASCRQSELGWPFSAERLIEFIEDLGS